MEFITAGVLVVLVAKLEALLQEENLQKSVKGRIKYLRALLESMQADLEKVSDIPTDHLDKNIMLWARYVQEISYDIDYRFDDTVLVRLEGVESEKQQNNIIGFTDWSIDLLSKARIRAKLFSKVQIHHETAADMKDILGFVKEAKERRDIYNVQIVSLSPAAASIDPRNANLYRKAIGLVGINEAKDKVIEMLLNRNCKSVSIYGSGGLGKTTLAKIVYRKLKTEFDCWAFVQVGRNPDIKKTFKSILLKLDKKKYDDILNTASDEKQLVDLLRECLRNKRYFIVIDDLHDINFWEAFKLALSNSSHGSRIMTTSRKIEVAREASDVYVLEPLSYDNSKKLFNSRIFGGEENCPDNQTDDVTDKILNKCGGVPLAITTMASLLAAKPREKWFEVYSSMRLIQKENQCMENTMRILSYCYNDMPSQMRNCLLFLSTYPENYIISKNFLIWKWIAEGFVHGGKGIGLFELGERYFIELMNRGMIMPVQEKRQLGYVDRCCLHDMVLSLIRSMSFRDNFITIFDHEKDTLPHMKICRFSYQRMTMENNPQANEIGMLHVRSFIACLCKFPKMFPLSAFRALRVLALERCRFMESYRLSSLGDLVHLRYLGLAATPICELPNEIGALKLLQTLDLAETGIKQLPSCIGLLTQLMCLRGMSTTKAPVDGTINKLTSLEELWIDPAGAIDDNRTAEKFIIELGNLKKMRVLATNIPATLDESIEEALLQSVCSMPRLHYLFVQFLSSRMSLKFQVPSFVPQKCLRYLWLGGIEFSVLPAWINSSLLPNLCFLRVGVQYVDRQAMLTLGMLPELCCLHLFTTSLLAINCSGGFFRKLRSLVLARATFMQEKCGVPIVPSLEDLYFVVDVSELKGFCTFYGQSISSFLPTLFALHSIPMLVKVRINIFCEGAASWEVEETEAALKNIVKSHINHPKLEIQRDNEDGMTTSNGGQQPRMDKYRVLDFHVHVQDLNAMCYAFDFTILGSLPSLEKVICRINCEDATIAEVEAAEEALRLTAASHPNHPTLEMERYSEDKMKLSYDDIPAHR